MSRSAPRSAIKTFIGSECWTCSFAKTYARSKQLSTHERRCWDWPILLVHLHPSVSSHCLSSQCFQAKSGVPARSGSPTHSRSCANGALVACLLLKPNRPCINTGTDVRHVATPCGVRCPVARVTLHSNDIVACEHSTASTTDPHRVVCEAAERLAEDAAGMREWLL